jgi:hypothetical protein
MADRSTGEDTIHENKARFPRSNNFVDFYTKSEHDIDVADRER